MIIPSLSLQEPVAVQNDLRYFGNEIGSDCAVSFIAMMVGRYAQNFFNTIPEQERKLLKAFLVGEWDVLQQWNAKYSLQSLEKINTASITKEWCQLYQCYNPTVEKVQALKAFIQASQICEIFPDSLCKDSFSLGGIRPAHAMTLTSKLRRAVGISQKRFAFLASIQTTKSVTIMVISQRSWNLLNSWLEDAKRLSSISTGSLINEGCCCAIL